MSLRDAVRRHDLDRCRALRPEDLLPAPGTLALVRESLGDRTRAVSLLCEQDPLRERE